ncbi:hypothetical protein BGZ49_002393 [Haplosporangium sp. Z 27]|nr:hypothetical protein BGZ49_002393 [Haplosporangium sp. Z 27]
MSTPLYVVFDKRLSKKPSLPSPSMQPQSILIKGFSCHPSDNIIMSSSLYARRGSSSSSSSTSSARSIPHDCGACGLFEDESESKMQNIFQGGSKSLSTGSPMSMSETPSKQRRIQWVDQL